jgi:hypothetical protein
MTAIAPQADRWTRLRFLRAGDAFTDGSQHFTKLGVITNRKGQKRHVVACTWSPVGRRKVGPVVGAFFTEIGSVLYLGGNREVCIPHRPLLMQGGAA